MRGRCQYFETISRKNEGNNLASSRTSPRPEPARPASMAERLGLVVFSSPRERLAREHQAALQPFSRSLCPCTRKGIPDPQALPLLVIEPLRSSGLLLRSQRADRLCLWLYSLKFTARELPTYPQGVGPSIMSYPSRVAVLLW